MASEQHVFSVEPLMSTCGSDDVYRRAPSEYRLPLGSFSVSWIRAQEWMLPVCAYICVAAIVFGVGYLGAYVVAAHSMGVALGVILGGMLPLVILIGLCALRINTLAAGGVAVAGAAIAVIIVATGEINCSGTPGPPPCRCPRPACLIFPRAHFLLAWWRCVGLLWKPVFALKALDTYDIPVNSGAPLPVQAGAPRLRLQARGRSHLMYALTTAYV